LPDNEPSRLGLAGFYRRLGRAENRGSRFWSSLGRRWIASADLGGAYVDADDAHHEACLELLETHPGPLLVPTLAVTEVVYLIQSRLGWQAEVRFLGDLASGSLIVEQLPAGDLLRMAELVSQYRDLPLGTVDASIVAAAERLGIQVVATLDRRHFSVTRPRHVPAFTLLP
jgi:predicted nucleic acid-binding protein